MIMLSIKSASQVISICIAIIKVCNLFNHEFKDDIQTSFDSENKLKTDFIAIAFIYIFSTNIIFFNKTTIQLALVVLHLQVFSPKTLNTFFSCKQNFHL